MGTRQYRLLPCPPPLPRDPATDPLESVVLAAFDRQRFFERLRRQALALCEHVAPEIFARPLYLRTFEELGLGVDGASGLAITKAYLFRDELHGQWRGAGCLIAVNTWQIQQVAKSPPFASRETKKAIARDLFLQIVIHELSHLVEQDYPEGDLPPWATASRIAWPRETSDTVREFVVEGNPKSLPAWHDHRLPFIRAALHAVHRAADPHVRPSDVFDARAYGLSRTTAYVEALGDEPERLRRLSFVEIRNTEPPAAFVELWERDTRQPDFGEMSMALKNVLQKLVAAVAGKKAERARTYLELVAAVVDGDEPTVETLELALAQASKTTADFENDVARLTRRRELAAALAASEDSEDELGVIAGQKEFLAEELRAAKEKHDAAWHPLRARERHIHESISRATSLRDQLRQSAPRELHEQHAALSSQARQLAAQHKAAFDEAERQDERAKKHRKLAADKGHWGARNYHVQEVEHMEELAQAQRDRMAEIDAEQEQIQAKLTALWETEMLRP